MGEDWTTYHWRVGRKVGRTIYACLHDEASDDDPLIGVMDTPELAERAVIAHNNEVLWEQGDDTRPRFSGGARSQEDEDRCAPLRAVLQRLVDLEEEGGPDVFQGHWWVMAMEGARDVLERHRERSGDGA